MRAVSAASTVLFMAMLTGPILGQPAPAWHFDFGEHRFAFQSNGTFSLTTGEAVRIRQAALYVFGPGWKAVIQSKAQITTAPELSPAGGVFRGQLKEPVSGRLWQFEQRVKRGEQGLDIEYLLRPQAEMEINEVSLVFDLPIKLYAGKQLLLFPQTESSFPREAPEQYHFVSGNCRAAVFGGGERPQLSLRFPRTQFCNVQDTRQWQGENYQAFVKIVPSATKVQPGQEWRLALTVLPDDPREYAMPGTVLQAQDKLEIRSVKLSAQRVPRYELCELTVDLRATYDTPFDERQVALEALVRTPSGRELKVPGFFYQGYQREVSDETELLTPQGDATWKVRFAPTEVGRHEVRLIARDRSGEVTSKPVSFEATKGDRRGFVRVSKQDPQYFEFDDGTPYFAIGDNCCWYDRRGTAAYDEWFAAMGANGCSYARLWMPQWAFGIEWGKPGVYRMDRAWQLDYVFRLAEKHGIYIKLCLENWRRFGRDKPVYAQAQGGPCKTEHDFFLNEEARRMFRNRLRYCVARWGYSTHLLAWELWNEINCVAGYHEYSDDVVAWSAEMCRYLKSTDPWQHVTVNSLGSCNFNEKLWERPEIEFAQMHGYYYFSDVMKQQAVDMADFIPRWQRKVRAFGKPAMFAEFGLTRSKPEVREMCDQDQQGVHLHNGMWSALADGGCGTAMLWWWDSYIAPQKLYWQFKPVAQFVREVPWTTAGFRDVQAAVRPDQLRVYGRQGPELILLWVQNRRHTWWNVVHHAEIGSVTGGQVEIAGVRDGSWTAEWWDTWEGGKTRAEQVQAANGKLLLNVPRLERDVAVKIKRG